MHDQAEQDLELLLAAARQAGAIARRFFKKTQQVWMKQGGSPVTEADFAVNHFLENHLQSARPSYGWLSEESKDTPERLAAKKLFIIDPIDGTRGFMKGSDNWTISLAIVAMEERGAFKDKGRPVIAALYNPIRDEMFSARLGKGARLNGKALKVSPKSTLEGGMISMPGALFNAMRLQDQNIQRIQNIPSLAYRLALVASGRIDATLAKPYCHDWDLAAADLLVHEAGGVIVDKDNQPLSYNAVQPRHGPLVAANQKLAQSLLELID